MESFMKTTDCSGAADSSYTYSSDQCVANPSPEYGGFLSENFVCGSGMALSTSNWFAQGLYTDSACQSLGIGTAWKNQVCISQGSTASTMYDYPKQTRYSTADCTGAEGYSSDLSFLVGMKCSATSSSGLNSYQYFYIEN
jgi:hypothetical protein